MKGEEKTKEKEKRKGNATKESNKREQQKRATKEEKVDAHVQSLGRREDFSFCNLVQRIKDRIENSRFPSARPPDHANAARKEDSRVEV